MQACSEDAVVGCGGRLAERGGHEIECRGPRMWCDVAVNGCGEVATWCGGRWRGGKIVRECSAEAVGCGEKWR